MDFYWFVTEDCGKKGFSARAEIILHGCVVFTTIACAEQCILSIMTFKKGA
jgi:hypothetical protein